MNVDIIHALKDIEPSNSAIGDIIKMAKVTFISKEKNYSKEIKDRIFYFFAKTDSTFDIPDTDEGKVIRLLNNFLVGNQINISD